MQTVSGKARHFHNLDSRVYAAGIFCRDIDVEWHVGKQISLGEDEQVGLKKIDGYFSGLSSPSVTLSSTIFAASPRS